MMARLSEEEYPHTQTPMKTPSTDRRVDPLSVERSAKKPVDNLFSSLIHEVICVTKDTKRSSLSSYLQQDTSDNNTVIPAVPVISLETIRPATVPSDRHESTMLKTKRTQSDMESNDEEDEVHYDDPESRLARTNIMGALSLEKDPAVGCSTQKIPGHDQEQTNKKPRTSKFTPDIACDDTKENSIQCESNTFDISAESRRRHFLLSSMSADDKIKCSEIVANLGGTVEEGSLWLPGCTHLVTGGLARSEKLLAAIAAGRW